MPEPEPRVSSSKAKEKVGTGDTPSGGGVEGEEAPICQPDLIPCGQQGLWPGEVSRGEVSRGVLPHSRSEDEEPEDPGLLDPVSGAGR